jgi:hypothetical protein
MAYGVTMTCDHISVKWPKAQRWSTVTLIQVTYVMWQKEHLWNVSVLQRVHLSNLLYCNSRIWVQLLFIITGLFTSVYRMQEFKLHCYYGTVYRFEIDSLFKAVVINLPLCVVRPFINRRPSRAFKSRLFRIISWIRAIYGEQSHSNGCLWVMQFTFESKYVLNTFWYLDAALKSIVFDIPELCSEIVNVNAMGLHKETCGIKINFSLSFAESTMTPRCSANWKCSGTSGVDRWMMKGPNRGRQEPTTPKMDTALECYYQLGHYYSFFCSLTLIIRNALFLMEAMETWFPS